jgi:hypothetical protein
MGHADTEEATQREPLAAPRPGVRPELLEPDLVTAVEVLEPISLTRGGLAAATGDTGSPED